MHRYYVIFAIISICLIVFCSRNKEAVKSTIPPANTIKIKILEECANNHLKKNNANEAIILYQKAIDLTKDFDTSHVARLYIKIGSGFFNTNNLKNSISNLQYGLSLYNNSSFGLKRVDFKYKTSGTILLANCYRLLNMYDSALYCLDELKKTVEHESLKIGNRDKNAVIAEVYTWKGLVFYDLAQFEKSFSNNVLAIKLLEKDSELKYLIYNNYAQLGKISVLNQDFVKAEQYHKKAAKIIKQHRGDSSVLYAEQISDLGFVYFESKRYADALECFQITHAILEKHLPINAIHFAYSYNNLADAYSGLNHFSKGIIQYNLAIELFKKHGYLEEVCVVYHNLGIAYFNMNNYVLSEQYYKQSLELSSSVRPHKDIYTSYIHQRLGQLYFKQKEYELAIKYYSNAINELCIIDNDSTFYDATYIQKYILSKTELFKSLYYKGRCELNAYYDSNDKKYLFESVVSFQKALQLQDIIKKQFNNEKTMLSLSKLSNPLVNDYLISLLNMRKLHPGYYIDNKIFEAIERNKYTTLRSLIHTTKTIHSVQLPVKWTRQIDSLYRRIRYYNNSVSNNKFHPDKVANTKIIEKRLFESTFSLDTLLNSLKIKYPGFKKSQYNFSYYTISEIQDFLPEATGIIEYYYNDSIIVIFAINKNSYHVYQSVPDKEISAKKNELLKSIKFSNTRELIQNGKYFFNQLINPVGHIIDDLSSLIIIPDVFFSDLPFEILINQRKLVDNQDIQQQEFLIKRFNISYQYSLNLWGDNMHSSISNIEKIWANEFSGFAPLANTNVYDNSGNPNPKVLPYTKLEVDNIAKIFTKKGDKSILYVGSCSKEEIILKELLNSRIVHIASHSLTNCNPDNYCIVLEEESAPNQYSKNNPATDNDSTPFSIIDGRLSLSEIYNTDINSELVTLSVCSSGFGDKFLGEGRISLAQAFYYSGARNILYTLWDVSDKHTKIFMTTFYSYISFGYTYSAALRKTKIDFINSNFQLPKLWCGYLLNG